MKEDGVYQHSSLQPLEASAIRSKGKLYYEELLLILVVVMTKQEEEQMAALLDWRQ
jgi:hypothetical protein